MAESPALTREIMLAAETTGKEKGIFLFNGKLSQAGEYKLTHSNPLQFKQRLFHTHSLSFYGVAFSIRTFKLQLKNEKQIEIAGVWIPAGEVHLLAGLDQTDQEYVFHHSLSSFLSFIDELTNRLNIEDIYPGRDGVWRFSRHITNKLSNLKIPFMNKTATGTKLGAEEPLSSSLLPVMEEWLQEYFLSSEKLAGLYFNYKNRLAEHTSDRHIKKWTDSFEEKERSYLLPKNIYPVALKYWNGETPEPFQLQLAIHEPISSNQGWKMEWFVKEWQSGHMIALEHIAAGSHPFRTNPVPWLKSQFIQSSHPQVFFSFKDPSCYHLEVSQKVFADFLLNEVSQLENQGISVLIPETLKRKVLPRAKAVISVFEDKDDQDLFSPWVRSHITWKLTIADKDINEEEFRKLVNQQQRILQVNNQWVIWDAEMAEKLLDGIDKTMHDESFSFFDAFRRSLIQKNDVQSLTHVSQADEFIEWKLNSEAEKLLNFSEGNNRDAILAPYWKGLLKPYQQTGTHWLLTMRKLNFGCCLADDMGLGKTLQTIAYMDELAKHTKPDEPFLIVCPSSLVHHWIKEIEKHTENTNLLVYEGLPDERRKLLINNGQPYPRIVISSYAVAAKDILHLQTVKWTSCIFDEAQHLKNSRTKQRQALKALSAGHKIALTGTPVENHPFEIWSLMDLLNPGLLRDKLWFSEHFLQSRDKDRKEENMTKLRAIIRPFMLRRTKNEFLKEWELPEKNITEHTVSLTKEQMVLYEAVTKEWSDSVEDQSEEFQRAQLFKTMTKLKQICNHPGQLTKALDGRSFSKGRSGKWDLAVKLIEEWQAQGKRGLVFTQYRYIGYLFQSYAKAAWDLSIPFFHGGLSSTERKEMINTFQHSQTVPFMVISLRAGGFGLNLTEATEVLHFDRWWNPAVEAQATDRVHRIGQTKPVNVHTIITKGTIEERIAHLIKEKNHLHKAVIDGRPLPIWTLSKDELTELFTFQ
ncbi:DEAD/DEAH box helicase [Salipaludibacillus aurantiacus]|uniref:Superfamily II DNA or RNA helicase, SNF2 family n=1 Tax=Salipaludibacillus aurantiacus TaxID=1601833 RepID=A0A1H9TAK9_9BACI|nr:DEAD/DEAH box helicase [Salipaludibacillus aurantiacus]SER94077.1 Superfamily II DNA or RNA helicase, SNF2 family [Salipaludibacillus aurantiacus]